MSISGPVGLLACLALALPLAAQAVTCTPRITLPGAGEHGTQFNPAGQRLRSAVSADGLAFTRTGLALLDRSATPSLVLVDGLPYLYFTADNAYGGRDGAELAIGSADGLSWQACELQFSGIPDTLAPVDPDVVVRSDGGLRMYVTGPLGGGLVGIHYLDSDDGLNWSYGGVAFSHTGSILDSVTFQAAGGWQQFALEASSIAMVRGSSADGTAFTFADSSQRTIDGHPQVISQAAEIAGTLHLFTFGPPDSPGIHSFTTGDGATLSADPTLHLAFDPGVDGESIFIKDPAVVSLADGSYLMVYSTAICLFHGGFEP